MIKKAVLDLLKQQSLTMSQLSEQLNMTNATDFNQLVKLVAKLEQKGEIILTASRKLALPKEDTLIGIYRANDKGYGFISVEGEDEDYYVQKGMQLNALSGDTVQFKVLKQANVFKNRGAEAKVIEIVQRELTQFVGEFVAYPPHLIEKYHYFGYVIPKDKKVAHLTCFIDTNGLKPVDGTICLVSITDYPTSEQPKSVYGTIIKELGHKNDPGIDILAILHHFDIPHEFPQDVLDEASQVEESIRDEELVGRVDLRQELVITIDGDDAKDLDDAISLTLLDNGHYQLGVHIADVSYYVKKDSALDKEAYNRATSVYLTDRVVPMLPQRLSNGICSLHPHVDRLTQSCIMEIDASGKVIDYKIVESVIQSKKRMTYERVNMALVEQNKKAQDEYALFLPMLEHMRQLHYALYHERRRRGAIDFEDNEAKIIVDDEGHPLDIVLRDRGLAERMIESFMLAANETVAAHFMAKKLPMIYRVHEHPSEEKMQRFLEFITVFGITVKGQSATITSKQLQKVLAHVEDRPYEMVVSTMLLRSMKQARYDNMPLGHFGLATATYTHFTSPIRRYPDLIVHRMIRYYAKHGASSQHTAQLNDELENIAHQSSLMERRAVNAERETLALKKAEYMVDKINQKFEGIVSSVTRFGFFVELPNTIEGLIHVSKITDDHYEFIDSHMMLIGQKTGKIIQIGQKMTVIVSKVDVESREIDFEIYMSNKEKKNQRLAMYHEKNTLPRQKKKSKKMKQFVKKKRR